jgi:hypothetical protein
MAAAGDGASKILTLWNSYEFMGETREGASEQVPQPLCKTARDSGNNLQLPCRNLPQVQKKVTIETLSKKGL